MNNRKLEDFIIIESADKQNHHFEHVKKQNTVQVWCNRCHESLYQGEIGHVLYGDLIVWIDPCSRCSNERCVDREDAHLDRAVIEAAFEVVQDMVDWDRPEHDHLLELYNIVKEHPNFK